MVQVTVDVPKELIDSNGKSKFAQQMRLAAAIYWYAHADMSMGKAAQLAGLSRAAFLDVLAHEKIDVFQVDFEDLEQEISRG